MEDLGLTQGEPMEQGDDQVGAVGTSNTSLDIGSLSPGSQFSGFPSSLPSTPRRTPELGTSRGMKLPLPLSYHKDETKGSKTKKQIFPGPAPKEKVPARNRHHAGARPDQTVKVLGEPAQDTGTLPEQISISVPSSSPAYHEVTPARLMPEIHLPRTNPRPVAGVTQAAEAAPHLELAQVLASITAFREEVKYELVQQRQEMVQQKEKLEGQISHVQAQLSHPQGNVAPHMMLPAVESLPTYDSSNPWRPALFAPYAGGLLTIEGLGTRPITDFERFPENAELPYCYVRLSEDAAIREDKVPRETVIYSRERAQSCLVQELKAEGCTNSRILPHNGSLTIFQTPVEMEMPFASKVISAVNQALREDKASPKLREEEFTSLLLPGDTEPWKDILSTFTTGKLSLNAAAEQFNEDLPLLTDTLVKAEYEAKSRFARTLHTFSLLELTANQNPEVEFMRVIVKSMTSSLRFDAFAFGEARRKCRKHVLQNARIRHEPAKLINGPIFGEHLFPNHLVQEAIEAASRANQSLRTRWDLPLKRKYTEGHGPHPKNRDTQWSRRPSFKISKIPQPASQGIPVSASAPGPSQFVLLPNPSQSSAHNQGYERQATFRPPGFSYQHQGRRSGRGKGRSFQQGQSNSQNSRRSRGRSQSHRRGRGRGGEQ